MQRNKNKVTISALALSVALFLTSCAPSTIAPETAPTSEKFSSQSQFNLGETIQYGHGILFTVRSAGQGPPSETVAGANPADHLAAYNVYVENHSQEPLDLSEATVRLQYTIDGVTYTAPSVSDLSNDQFGEATSLLPTPVPPNKASNGAWLFAVPEHRDSATLQVTLGPEFTSVHFRA